MHVFYVYLKMCQWVMALSMLSMLLVAAGPSTLVAMSWWSCKNGCGRKAQVVRHTVSNFLLSVLFSLFFVATGSSSFVVMATVCKNGCGRRAQHSLRDPISPWIVQPMVKGSCCNCCYINAKEPELFAELVAQYGFLP